MEGDWGERVGEDLNTCFEINASRLQRLTRTTPRGESSKVDILTCAGGGREGGREEREG
jgi:hypothetical protein